MLGGLDAVKRKGCITVRPFFIDRICFKTIAGKWGTWTNI